MALESSVSGELGGDPGLFGPPSLLVPGSGPWDDPVGVPVTKLPNELLANNVPFLGGLPILFPLLENLVVPLLVGLTGPDLGLIPDLLDSEILVSILSGLAVRSPLMGIILAGESFR